MVVRRLLRAAAVAFWLLCGLISAPAATTTSVITLTAGAWTDVTAALITAGVITAGGPLQIWAQGPNQTTYAIADATPSLLARAYPVHADVPDNIQTTSHVWAEPTGSVNTTIWVAPLTSWGGSGGGGGSVVVTSLPAGFLVASTYTPLSATTSSSTTSITGSPAEILATNVGATNGAYCTPGATATTSSQYIAPSGGWFAFQANGATTLACITATGTTTVNVQGGSGLATGTGGGGGGGGSSAPADSTLTATGTLSAADTASTATTGANGQTILTWASAPTTGSTEQFAGWSGVQTGLLICYGTFSATLEFDVLMDAASPGHYVQQTVQTLAGQNGSPTSAASFTAPIIGTVNLTGSVGGQIRATAYASGSPTCTLRITTNLSQVNVVGSSAVQPVSGTVTATSSAAITNPTATLTLSSTTTAYAANQLMCSSATAATCNTALAASHFAIANSAGGAYIPRLRLQIADTTSTGPYNGTIIQIDLWSAAPTFTNGDRGAYLIGDRISLLPRVVLLHDDAAGDDERRRVCRLRANDRHDAGDQAGFRHLDLLVDASGQRHVDDGG